MKAAKNQKKEDVELRGTVVEKPFGEGSKSEHAGIFLQTEDGDYQLRRLGGNPFADPELKKFIGKEVMATGRLAQSLFVANSIKKVSG